MTVVYDCTSLNQAEEHTPSKRRARARLVITVEAKDIHPPALTVSATEGWVDENSPLGTLVLDKQV